MPSIEYYSETRSALLPVRIAIQDDLRERAEADGFEMKDEFHMTVLPAVSHRDMSPGEVDAFRYILDEQEVNDFRLCRQFLFHIKKPKLVEGEEFPRESIIVLGRSERVSELLSRHSLFLFGMKPPRQFPHVTLFTKGDNPYARRGIGIDSWMDFAGMDPQSYPPRP